MVDGIRLLNSYNDVQCSICGELFFIEDVVLWDCENGIGLHMCNEYVESYSKNNHGYIADSVPCSFCGLKIPKAVFYLDWVDGKEYRCDECAYQRALNTLSREYRA